MARKPAQPAKLAIETVPVGSLSLDPANLRRHPERNLETIKASLRRFGQQKPIVVGPNNVVVAGNGTLEAAKALGWTEIAIVRTSLSGSDAVAFGIADNRTAELAEWDDGLADVLAALAAEDEALRDAAGFDADELAGLLAAGNDHWSETSGRSTGDKMGVGTMGDIEYRVIVDCEDEDAQASLIEKLEQEGHVCRPLMS